MSEEEKELQFYKSNPKRYAELVKQIANLKTTDEGFLERKRNLIQGAKKERERLINKCLGDIQSTTQRK